MSTLRIQLLGNFRLVIGDEPLTSVNTPRLQALLAYLVLHREAPPLRQHMAFQLWPDSSENQARTNLRKLFFQLQQALPHAKHFLLADTQTLVWNVQADFILDVAELQQHLAHLQKEPLDLAALRRVVELYQGELLPSCYDDWILPLRQELHRAVMAALERLITLLENQRAYSTGIEYARRLLAFDPLEEKSYQRLMRLHALDGDYSGALRVYQDCVAVLQRELDVEPDEETQALYERLRRRDSTLVAKAEPKPQQPDLLPLVGRQQEWQTLQRAWRQAVQGQAHFVCIWGEAGMGKTRLAEELLDWAGHQGVLTARTRSYQAQGALAYAPVTTLLRSPTLSSRLGKLGNNWLSEVARLLPELLEQHPGLPIPQPMTESWQRQRFFEALARAVLVDEQPLLLLFDDLHWCDQETLAWLNYLLHFAPHSRLLVVGTSRIEEVDDAHPLTTLRLGLRREALTIDIELTPLNAAEVTALADTIAEEKLTSDQAQRLYANTEGNPLFVVEMVRAGQETGPGEQGGVTAGLALSPPPLVSLSTLPPKVYAVIRSRLTQLSPAAQKITNVAATIGRSFSFAVLLAASHLVEDDLIDNLDELVKRRIIREQGGEGYDFSHDRIRDVAYTELSQTRRRQLHQRAAEALESVYRTSLDEISTQVATHYEQSAIPGKAAHYWRHAGERALTQFAQLDAIRYLSRALELTPSDDWSQRYEMLLARVKVYNYQGMRPEGQQDLAALQGIVRTHNDGTQVARKRQAEVALCLAEYGRGISDYTVARAAAQEAVALAEQGGVDDLAAQAYFLLGEADLWAHQYFARARTWLEQALPLARKVGLHRTEGEVLTALSVHWLYSGGLLTQIEAMAQQCLVAYQKYGDPVREAGALSLLAYLIYTQREGNYDLGVRYCERGLQLVAGSGWWDAERLLLGMLGSFRCYQGDYARAQPCLDRQLVIIRQAQNGEFEANGLIKSGCLALEQGDYGQAQSYLEASLRLFQEKGSQQQYRVKVLGHLALLHHNRGGNTQASGYAAEAVHFARKLPDPRVTGDALTRCARVWVSQGRLDEAADFFQQALTCFRQVEQWNHTLMPLAGLAEIALRQGEPVQAQAHVNKVLTHLATHQLDRTDEELYVYMTSYQVLYRLQDPRAVDLLRLAKEQLQVRAASLETTEQHQMFWSAPPHAAVLVASKR